MSREPHCLALLLTHQLQKLQVSHATAAACLLHHQPATRGCGGQETGRCSTPSSIAGRCPGGWFTRQPAVAALSCMFQQSRHLATELGCPDAWQTCNLN